MDRAISDGRYTDRESILSLCNMNGFREHFRNNNNEIWYDVLNAFQNDNTLFQDLIVEINILTQQVNYALNNIQIRNRTAIVFLTRFSQRPQRLQNMQVYSEDQVKYVGNFILDIMAGWDQIDGYRETDIFWENINHL